MVIHDLRNPAESIKQGLTQAKTFYQKELNDIIQETNKIVLSKVIHKIIKKEEYQTKSIKANKHNSTMKLS